MDNQINLRTIWRSKLAQRLIPIFVGVVAIPVVVTVMVVGHVGQDQIIGIAHTLEHSNVATVADAGLQFQRLGQDALRQSNYKIAKICVSASKDAAQQSLKDQGRTLAVSGASFADVTQKSFNGAMHQSLSSNKQVLSGIGVQMGTLFANSADFTRDRVGDRVQSAMLERINSQMSERAGQLAQMFDAYIQTNVNYLGLSAEMVNLYENNPSSQKAVIDALIRRFPMMSVVSIMNSKGVETIKSSANSVILPSELKDQSTTDYFKAAISDSSFIGIDHVPSDGSAPVLRLAVPLEMYRGKAIGVLSACLSLDDLWDTIRNARFGHSGYAYVKDGIGSNYFLHRSSNARYLEQSAEIESLHWKLVVAEPQSEVMQPIQAFKSDISRNTQRSLDQMHGDIQMASGTATAKLLKDASGLRTAAIRQLQAKTAEILAIVDQQTSAQSRLDQDEMQTAVQRQIIESEINNNSAMVGAARTASLSLEQRIPAITSTVLEQANSRMRFCAGIIVLVSCGLSCLTGFLLAGALLKPILLLSQGTRSVADGDLNKRVNERAPAEIGDLAVAFNMMAASLQQSRADLTDAESQLVQSAKLASLGTLSAGVAHELNQPVAIVRGLAQQMKSDTSISPDVKEDLDIIVGQTGRMMKIITHLRTFCRTGGVEKLSIDVNQVVYDCFILIDAQLKSHGVSVEMNLSDRSLSVIGDANELEQVFINLITNARDATENVPNALLTISSRIEGNDAVLEFRDNGTGVPESVAEHIFDPFFTTKDVGKGTGLGLSISHGIIQKHKGSISVRNDHGAVFTITLPLDDSSEDASLPLQGPSIPRRQAA
jgi:C4-dicarboxylate-specific signal transduction histidine kinase